MHSSLLALVLLLISTLALGINGAQPPAREDSPDRETAPTAQQLQAAFDQGVTEARAESTLLSTDPSVPAPGSATANHRVYLQQEPDEDVNPSPDSLSDLDDLAETAQQNPPSASPVATGTPTFADVLASPRAVLLNAIRTHAPQHAAQLTTAVDRVAAGQGLPSRTAARLIAARIAGWQAVLLDELRVGGGAPIEGILFNQDPTRYLANAVSFLAWPPTQAVREPDMHRVGEGGTLTEGVLHNMGERDVNPSLLGNVDTSYVGFHPRNTKRSPMVHLLTVEQRAAIHRFHIRLFPLLLEAQRFFMLNGGDVYTDLWLVLLSANILDIESVPVDFHHQSVDHQYLVYFVRARGEPIENSSILLLRRHPQALDRDAHPTLYTKMAADVASAILRALARNGAHLPVYTPRTSEARLARAHKREPDDWLDPLACEEYKRLKRLARSERALPAPLPLDAVRSMDYRLGRYIDRVLARPDPGGTPYPAPPHIAGSPVQRATHFVNRRGAQTRLEQGVVKRKAARGEALSAEEAATLQQREAAEAAGAARRAAKPHEPKEKAAAAAARRETRTWEEVQRSAAQLREFKERREKEEGDEHARLQRERNSQDNGMRGKTRNIKIIRPGAPPIIPYSEPPAPPVAGPSSERPDTGSLLPPPPPALRLPPLSLSSAKHGVSGLPYHCAAMRNGNDTSSRVPNVPPARRPRTRRTDPSPPRPRTSPGPARRPLFLLDGDEDEEDDEEEEELSSESRGRGKAKRQKRPDRGL